MMSMRNLWMMKNPKRMTKDEATRHPPSKKPKKKKKKKKNSVLKGDTDAD